MEVKGYVANLGKYNEGELVGEWVTFPVDEEEFAEILQRIGISDEPDENGMIYEEYFFPDWYNHCELDFGEFESLARINEVAENVEGLDDIEEEILDAMVDYGYSPECALDAIGAGDYMYYPDAENMTDVAYQVVEQTCDLNSVDDVLARYFDYELYGRDLALEGTFLPIESGYVELLN